MTNLRRCFVLHRLFAIDLLVKDPHDHLLVGFRRNAPAKNFYFVPGGRIRKNETIRDAFARILCAETGYHATLDDARLLGVFEHFYTDDPYGRSDYGSHYIVLAYELRFDLGQQVVLDAQHAGCRWMSEAELKAAVDVHDNVKAYFRPTEL